MKTSITSVMAAILLGSAVTFYSCKDKDNEPALSAKIQQIAPAALLDDLKKKGMPINEGVKPPTVDGIFVSSPHTCLVPYGPDDPNQAGYQFTDLTIQFSNQNSEEGSIVIATKSGSTTSKGIGGFISGSGNKFSIFAELEITNGSATGKQIRIFSGEITPGGIKDLVTTLVFTEKNDPGDYFLKVGQARIIKDGDGLASKINSFRVSAGSDKEIFRDENAAE